MTTILPMVGTKHHCFVDLTIIHQPYHPFGFYVEYVKLIRLIRITVVSRHDFYHNLVYVM